MPKSTRRGGLHPYQYWILWVLNGEGGSAELITIYQQVKAKLKDLMKPGREDVPVETSRGEPKWQNEIRYALRSMSADNNSGDGRVTHVRHGRWGITEKGRRWLGKHEPPTRWESRDEII